MGVNIATPEEGSGTDELQLVVILGMALPFAGPDRQPIVAPLGQVRIPMDKNLSEQLGKGLQDAAEKLPKKSDLITASSLQGVEQTAKFNEGLKG
jgi:hypothetical protein